MENAKRKRIEREQKRLNKENEKKIYDINQLRLGPLIQLRNQLYDAV
jgi:hypothetical protein